MSRYRDDVTRLVASSQHDRARMDTLSDQSKVTDCWAAYCMSVVHAAYGVWYHAGFVEAGCGTRGHLVDRVAMVPDRQLSMRHKRRCYYGCLPSDHKTAEGMKCWRLLVMPALKRVSSGMKVPGAIIQSRRVHCNFRDGHQENFELLFPKLYFLHILRVLNSHTNYS